MHSTPVSIARPKLANSSPMTSASPISIWCTPGGRFLIAGRACTALLTSPSGWPDSSISKFTLRARGEPAAELQRRPLAQHHRAFAAGHGQAFEQRQVAARAVLQLDDDRNLARGQVELGQRHV